MLANLSRSRGKLKVRLIGYKCWYFTVLRGTTEYMVASAAVTLHIIQCCSDASELGQFFADLTNS